MRASAALAGCLLAAGLAGCAGPAPELEGNAAAELQQRVLAVTSAAAGSDPATALKSLDGLASELDAAAAAGQVSFRRHQSITVAINAVRADLTAAAKKAAEKPAAPTPAPTTPQTVAPASGNSGKGNARDDEYGADSDNGKD
ncbi:mucin-associated surface protein [Arthrobacter sp. ISL-5]|nr:mucin-associated surface protein [Arthrobacter sp. ISL-5]